MTARRRNALAAIGLVAALALAPASRDADRYLRTAATMDGSEAQAVAGELSSRFRSPYAERVVLVVRGIGSVESDGGLAELTRIVASLRKLPEVADTISYLDGGDPLFAGRNGGTFVVIGIARRGAPAESLIPALRAGIDPIRRDLALRHPAAQLDLTGETPLNFDLRRTSADDARAAELRILPLTLLLLLFAFRGVAAALLPLLTGVLTMTMTLGAAALIGRHWPLSILVQNLAAMLGLGLGIDYALLIVSRFREARRAGLAPDAAADRARQQAAPTLAVSAATVAIGFAALLSVPISDLRSIGIAGFLVAVTSVFLSLTMLPAVLALLGSRIDRAPIAGAEARTGEQWRRWGRVVTAHPGVALAAASAPLLLLAMAGLELSSELPRGDWLPRGAESVRGLHALDEMERGGVVQSLRIVFEPPGRAAIATADSWNALGRFTTRLAADRRTSRVLSAFTVARGQRLILPLLPAATRHSFVSADGRAAVVEVIPAPGLSPAQQIAWVRELRAKPPSEFGGASIRVGGIPALNADYEQIVDSSVARVLTLVIVATLAALLAGFRSLLVAVKAIALNLLSVGAAFGALVLVFQRGYGGALFGVPGGTSGVFPIVPILTFAIVFGLSMDYEVFLVARVREARQQGLDESAAIGEALATTAGLITNAAAVMVAVFTAFAFGQFLVVKMLGFTLSVAVIIDATLVRIVIGPALLRLAGDFNWWPRGLTVARPAVAGAAE
jgi:RND superfamily putative drug exporter